MGLGPLVVTNQTFFLFIIFVESRKKMGGDSVFLVLENVSTSNINEEF